MSDVQTPDYWDDAADGYIVSAEPFTALFCEDAAALADIAPGMTLLDVATGPGALALASARRGAIVTAIDFSQTMVDRLAGRIGDLPVTALRMDGQALLLPEGGFDRACSVFGVPLFPDWRAGLRELARVLRPGGRAVVAVADNAYGFGPNQLLAAARAALANGDVPVEIEAMVVLADRDRLTDEMRRAGFGTVEIHERTHNFILDPASFVPEHPMIGRNPILDGLSDADRAATIARAIADAHRLANGAAIRIPGTARFAVGLKA